MARIGFDATPLLGVKTGIGAYVAAIADRVATDPDSSYVATAFSRAPRSALRAVTPAAISIAGRRVPARVLHAAWARTECVPVPALCGDLDLFHGTNFVLPPVGKARGVLTVHDLAYLRYPNTVSTASARYRELVPRGIARAAVVCTLTRAVAAEVQAEYNLDPARIVVTPPGVDAAWFEAVALDTQGLSRLGISGPYVIAVGTLEPRKNLSLLIEAHRALCHSDPETPQLVLAGPSGWGPDLGILPNDRVVLTGYLPVDALRSVVAGAELLAFPSLYEGFGLPPLEALATGVAVLANDLPSTREVLGRHAEFVDATDVDALAAGLAQCLGGARAGDAQATAAQVGAAGTGDVQATAAQVGAAGTGDVQAAAARREHARLWTWTRCTDAVLAAYATALES